MKLDKSKSQFLRSNLTSQTFKKQTTLQREAAKKYFQFKKSASQPSYFLNVSRLKKINQLYRAISLQKLSKNYSLQKSKSLHNSITPQKKNSFYNNHTFKKPPCLNTINMNRALQSSQKTKRLKLNNRNQQNTATPSMNNSVQSIKQSGTMFLLKQLQKLQQISNMTIEKAFVGQYDIFFKSLKQNHLHNRVGTLSQIKFLLSKFCNLMYICQQRILRISQKQMKSRSDKIQLDYSNTNAQLKKKTFKLQLLIKQINNLKDHNLKISKQLTQLKQKNKAISIQSYSNIKNEFNTINQNDQTLNKTKTSNKVNSKKKISHLQINNIFEMKIDKNQAQIKTPMYHQLVLSDNISKQNYMNQSQDSDSAINYFYKKNQNNIEDKQKQQNQVKLNKSPSTNYIGLNPQNKNNQPLNQKIQMIKHIRNLQKKQKQLIKTLMILKHDGIDIQRAFNQAISGQYNNQDVEQQDFQIPKTKLPRHIKKIKNKDSYEADSSIIQSIDGLTVRYLQGQCEQDLVFYPIKHEYKSKPLDPSMQNKLRLDFNCLYEQEDQYQDDKQEQNKKKDLPTI